MLLYVLNIKDPEIFNTLRGNLKTIVNPNLMVIISTKHTRSGKVKTIFEGILKLYLTLVVLVTKQTEYIMSWKNIDTFLEANSSLLVIISTKHTSSRQI